MAEYLLLLREDDADFSGYDQAKLTSFFEKMVGWSQKLHSEGLLAGVAPLKKDGGGKTVRKRNAALVIDGPYSEAKEAIVGYFIVLADSYETAAHLAKSCPLADVGGSVEIRELGAFPMPRFIAR